MKMKELFSLLSFGELSNLSIGSSGSGEIKTEDVPKLVVHLNDALTQLYSRFLLNTKMLTIEQISGITNYHLIAKFAETNDATPRPYIKDLPGEPFLDDVIRVLEVWDEFGRQFPLNDAANPRSLFTPAPQMLQVPYPVGGRPIYVVYQARHIVLAKNDLETEVIIPFVLERALKAYIAGKIFSNMSGQEHVGKGQEQMMFYEATCVEVEQKDLVNETFTTSYDKLHMRGFI